MSIEHDGRIYLINTTPERSVFAEITELIPHKASGLIADFIEANTGQPHYTYNYVEVTETDIIQLALELGHKFSISKAWKNLYDWAYFRMRRNKEEGNG